MIIGPHIDPKREHAGERIADVIYFDDGVTGAHGQRLRQRTEQSGLLPHGGRVREASHVGRETEPKELSSSVVTLPLGDALSTEDFEILVRADLAPHAAGGEERGVDRRTHGCQDRPATPPPATTDDGMDRRRGSRRRFDAHEVGARTRLTDRA